MATKMVLPILGQTMEEGTIIRWFKNEGETVAKGEPLLEVMTDKVNMEVESPESGVLRKILAQADEVVPIQSPIAIIGAADESIDALLSDSGGNGASAPAAVEAAPAPAAVISVSAAASGDRVFISPRARMLANQNGVVVDLLAGRGTGPNGRVVEKDVVAYMEQTLSTTSATPLAARIAEDKGIDLREIVGSGPRGKVTRDDVLQAVTPLPAPVFVSAEDTVIPFTGMRKMVGENMVKSVQSAPHVTLTTEVDMTKAVKIRGQIVEQFAAKYGTRVTFTDLIVKAVADALREHPIVNSSLQGSEIRIFGNINIGVAVAIDGGLVVPVLKNADRKYVPQISTELRALGEKAKNNKLSSDDITGGTFTVSNLGNFGIDIFNPIIAPGQSAILGVCRIAEKPVVVDGKVKVRSMMNLCLSFDHRVMDGAPAAQFLQKVKQLLESPYQLLI